MLGFPLNPPWKPAENIQQVVSTCTSTIINNADHDDRQFHKGIWLMQAFTPWCICAWLKWDYGL